MTPLGQRCLARAVALAALAPVGIATVAAAPPGFDLAQRTDCHATVEAFYAGLRATPPGAAHGASPLVVREAARRKAEDAVSLSTALAERWQRPVTERQLQAELERMARQTHSPQVLADLFAALDNDAERIAECLARPVLARRLVQGAYANDRSLHRAARAEAEAALSGMQTLEALASHMGSGVPVVFAAGDLDEDTHLAAGSPGAAELLESLLPHAAAALGQPTATLESLPVGEISPLIEEGDRFTAYAVRRDAAGRSEIVARSWPKRPFDEWWTEARAVFTSSRLEAAPGARYVLPTPSGLGGCTPDTWEPTANDIPDPRSYPTAVWTGAEMIAWGGNAAPIPIGGGGRYDPVTDTWTPTSSVGAPQARYLHTAVWTGTRMLVWGGVTASGGTNTGALYDPALDTWTPTSTGAGVPTGRYQHTAVWTGNEMIIWGGSSPAPTDTGARYDPAAGTWTSLPASPLAARYLHTAIWTGPVPGTTASGEMMVWGGNLVSGQTATGARWSGAGNTWTLLATTSAPTARREHTAVWTGTEMLVWGGLSGAVTFLKTGARYVVSSNTWLPMLSDSTAPQARFGHTAVWSGSRMIIWGGLAGGGVRLADGGRYDPVGNSWSATSSSGAPQRRERHAAVWTGTEMLVWGGDDYGFDGFIYLQTGARYVPASNSWSAMAAGAMTPEARRYSSMVWTGAEVLIWGGFGSTLLGTGARYDPALATWTPMNASGAPAARYLHLAVWTGTEMILWGGNDLVFSQVTGGRYDPLFDTWVATSTVGAPGARTRAAMIWTGREAVVIGETDEVGRYDPTSDTWLTSLAPEGILARRTLQSMVWDGDEVLVWGGRYGDLHRFPDDGGRYDPRHDSWRTLRRDGSPPPTEEATAIWTGKEMIVWGGLGENGNVDTGGRYEPDAGAWTETSTGGDVPSPRRFAAAVWTGSEMLVWGGITPNPAMPLDTGSRFDSLSDAWTAMSTGGAPQERQRHGAVFTDLPDTRMIVWGGLPNASSGGAYCVACTSVTWYRDADGDGHGDASITRSACASLAGWVSAADDCDDADPERFPGNAEVCGDLVDNDCNLAVDDATAPGPVPEVFVSASGASGLTIEWAYAFGGEAYDVTRGTLTALNGSGGDFGVAADLCVANDTTTRSASDPTPPPSLDAFWYLVRGANCAGNGSYDSGGPSQQGSRDPELVPPASACP